MVQKVLKSKELDRACLYSVPSMGHQETYIFMSLFRTIFKDRKRLNSGRWLSHDCWVLWPCLCLLFLAWMLSSFVITKRLNLKVDHYLPLFTWLQNFRFFIWRGRNFLRGKNKNRTKKTPRDNLISLLLKVSLATGRFR